MQLFTYRARLGPCFGAGRKTPLIPRTSPGLGAPHAAAKFGGGVLGMDGLGGGRQEDVLWDSFCSKVSASEMFEMLRAHE